MTQPLQFGSSNISVSEHQHGFREVSGNRHCPCKMNVAESLLEFAPSHLQDVDCFKQACQSYIRHEGKLKSNAESCRLSDEAETQECKKRLESLRKLGKHLLNMPSKETQTYTTHRAQVPAGVCIPSPVRQMVVKLWEEQERRQLSKVRQTKLCPRTVFFWNLSLKNICWLYVVHH